jgi:hypothetical protein
MDVGEFLAWAGDPGNLAIVLAFLIVLAVIVLLLRPPREIDGGEPGAAGDPSAAGTADADGDERRLPSAFEYLTRHGVKKWNEARSGADYVDRDFSGDRDGFQNEGNEKIWGAPLDLHDGRSRPVLSGIDLDGANLNGCKLHHADLRRAWLRAAHLEGTDLEGALLSNARLSDADLRKARLKNAVLAHADLRGANLEDANLEGANLAWADLRGAKGSRAKLDQCGDLVGARLAGATFDGARARFLIAGRNVFKKPFVWR